MDCNSEEFYYDFQVVVIIDFNMKTYVNYQELVIFGIKMITKFGSISLLLIPKMFNIEVYINSLKVQLSIGLVAQHVNNKPNPFRV